MRVVFQTVILQLLLTVALGSPAQAETPVAEASAATLPAANRLAEAAAKESQTLQRADDDSAAGESAKSSNLKNTSRADRKSPVDRQQKSRQAEQLRVRDKYRELQRLRIAARAATGSNPSSSDSATSAASGQSD